MSKLGTTGRLMALLAALAIFVGGARDASAQPAPRQLSDNCALNGICDGTDGVAGYPIRITQPGSYVLISNLPVQGPNGGIIIALANGAVPNAVSIDLGGFTITPVAQFDTGCVFGGPPPALGGGFNGIGIEAPPANAPPAVRIRNGTVRGFGATAISFGGATALIEDMYVCGNFTGVTAGAGSVIRDCQIQQHVGTGVSILTSLPNPPPTSTIIEDNIISGSGVHCLQLNGGGATIRNNVLTLCTSDGIHTANPANPTVLPPDMLIIENNVTNNGGRGIVVGAGSNVMNNIVNMNGGDGIVVGPASRVYGNVIDTNGGTGLNMGVTAIARDVNRTSWGNNVISDNGTAVSPTIANSIGVGTVCPMPSGGVMGAPTGSVFAFGNTGGNVINGAVISPSSCCGNGIAEGNEDCDDGNGTPADGCENNCQISTTGP